MATPGINAPTDGRVRIRDDYLEQNRNNPAAVIDIFKLTPTAAFRNVRWFAGQPTVVGGGRENNAHFVPKSLIIDGARTGAGGVSYTATSAMVNGCLRNEEQGRPMTERYACAQMHPCRYRFIYPNLTTARGIKLHTS